MIATLPRSVLRLVGVGLLVIAVGGTRPVIVRAQSGADTAAPHDEDKPGEPAVSNDESAKPAEDAPADAGASAPSGSPAASTSSTSPDSSAKPYSSDSSGTPYSSHSSGKPYASDSSAESD